MKRWISIGDFIINPDYFNMFYIEEVPVDIHYEWHIFGEDKHYVCWRLTELKSYAEAENILNGIREQILD